MVRKLFQEQCVLMNQIVWEKSKNWQLGIKIKIGNYTVEKVKKHIALENMVI